MESYKSLTCPYFTYGKCRFMEMTCVFSHNLTDSVRIPDDTCFFFLRGTCIKGSSCPKRHMAVEEIVSGREVDKVEDKPLSLEGKPVENIEVKQQQPKDPEKSYAFAAATASSSNKDDAAELAKREVCTFFEHNGFCLLPSCSNVHGELCELCGFYSIHPYNEKMREKHRKECTEEHEKQMEASFAFQRSKELTCAICLDVILEKVSRQSSRFGLLENCAHIYCIECIRTWRKSNFDKKNKRSCPQCRIQSDFVIPSEYFYEDKADKKKIIDTYKNALSDKHCKYFKNGRGKCPFEGACFYKHEYPDGRKAELPMPSERKRGVSRNDEAYNLILESLLIEFDPFGLDFDDSDYDWFD